MASPPDPRLAPPDRPSGSSTAPLPGVPRTGPADGGPVTRLRPLPVGGTLEQAARAAGSLPPAASRPPARPAGPATARGPAPPGLPPAPNLLEVARAAAARPAVAPAPVVPPLPQRPAAGLPSSPAATGEPESDTQPPTQWQRNEDDYLDGRSDIGRAVGNHTRELFVACEPGEALQQQFEHLRPSYIAVHDLACLASRHLLHAVAAAAGQPVQRLVIRRQGFGTTLAVLDYVDCPSEDQGHVRLYATDADEADTAVRHSLSRVLLCRAALAVVMVGDIPVHALSEQLQPLRQAVFSSDWECRHLVFMPLVAGPVAALTTLARALGAGTGIHTQVGSVATRPADAWSLLSAAWNQQQAELGQPGMVTRLPQAAPGHDALRPMPPTPARQTPPRAQDALQRLVEEVAQQPGVQACCLFDLASSKVRAFAGQVQSATDLARRGTLLLTAANTSRKHLGLPEPAEELLVKGGEFSLGLRRLHALPGLVLHVVYRPAQANWAQLRPRIMAMDAALPRAPVD